MPKTEAKDKGLKSLPPLSFRDSIQEMDANFLTAIQKPLQATEKAFNNVENYEKALEASKAKTEVGKKSKESTGKKFKELQDFKKGNSFNPLKDHEKATKIAEEILKIDANHKGATKVISDMKQYSNPQLFDYGS